MHHYDLLDRGDWTAESVLVVSPYVEEEFFRRMAAELRPAELVVVIDDGCRAEDVATVANGARGGRTKVRVALGGAPGLVHAKIFHVEWRTGGGQKARAVWHLGQLRLPQEW